MAIQRQLRRGSTSVINNSTGAEGELFYDVQRKQLVLQDGVTKGGIRIPRVGEVPQATESIIGGAKIATTQQALDGADNTTIITPKLLKSSSFGVGQTLKDVTTSRLIGTTYTNTTGKLIIAFVYVTSPEGKESRAVVNGIPVSAYWQTVGFITGYMQFTHTIIIPPNATYVVTGGSLIFWSELS